MLGQYTNDSRLLLYFLQTHFTLDMVIYPTFPLIPESGFLIICHYHLSSKDNIPCGKM